MSFAFHDPKILYFIVPGTGSNSFHPGMRTKYRRNDKVGDLLVESNPVKEWHRIHHSAHFTAEQIREIVSDEIWNYEKIFFVRDPFDWCNSLFNKGGVENVGMNNKHGMLHFLKTLSLTPYSWGSDRKGNLLADKIYRTEDLKDLFKKYEIPVRTANISKKSPNKYCDECIELIREKFVREWKHYDFDDSLKNYRKRVK